MSKFILKSPLEKRNQFRNFSLDDDSYNGLQSSTSSNKKFISLQELTARSGLGVYTKGS